MLDQGGHQDFQNGDELNKCIIVRKFKVMHQNRGILYEVTCTSDVYCIFFQSINVTKLLILIDKFKHKKKQVQFEKVNLYSSRNYFKNCSMVSSNIADLLHSSLIFTISRSKRFMLDEMTLQNASKFAIFLEYENPHIVFSCFSFRATFFLSNE